MNSHIYSIDFSQLSRKDALEVTLFDVSNVVSILDNVF